MAKKISIPHVSWRDGRPRFQPGRALRAEGHKGRDLRHDDGTWYTAGEALDWSQTFQQQRDEAAKAARTADGRKPDRASAGVGRPAGGPASNASARPVRHYTVEQMFEDWFASAKFVAPADPAEALKRRAAKALLSPKSVQDYKQKARVIETHDPSLYASAVDALDQPILVGLYEELVAERGLATARGAIAVLSAGLSWARRRGKTTFRSNSGVNPAKELGMSVPAPRVRFATRTEIAALVAAADAMGRPEIGDMVVLAVWTGQRQSDRVALQDKGLLNGRRWFRQAKTGAIVAIRQAPQLEARLKAAEARRKAARAAALLAASTAEQRKEIELRFAHVVLDEKRWVPFLKYHYSHTFAEVRALAVKGGKVTRPDGKAITLEACPSLADFWDLDLRDTSVTWMALAGSTVPEIIAVTGHTLESATRILKHYLARHPEMADSAIGKMMEWYDANGETETGL